MKIIRDVNNTWILEIRVQRPDGGVRVRRQLRATTMAEAHREARDVRASLEGEEA